MAWWQNKKKPLKAADKRDVPGDVFDKCKGCGEILYREKLVENLHVCPNCGFHLRIDADSYVELLTDAGSFEEFYVELTSVDPLGFVDLKPYPERLRAAMAKTGRNEAVITGTATLDSIPIALAVMDFAFLGGSMGSVVGEKITRLGLLALERKVPLIIVSSSGGARMQESTFSLMQMAKTSTALARLHEAGIPFISILTDPTTGGVIASHAMMGDANLAEPGALLAFSGPRVIKETIRQELPEGFQRSEFLEARGMVDRVVDRREMKRSVALLLRHMSAGWDA